jgi:NAD(P)-dependent dehydrogenase (short-subunit alcohol dehydrogenase family)
VKTLKNKVGVVFGGGGSIGAAASKQMAMEGAEVFVAGRRKEGITEVVKEISDNGGRAHAAIVDAENPDAVGAFLGRVKDQKGRLDFVFNAMGPRPSEYGNGTLAVDLPVEQYMLPLATLVRSQFITAQGAARLMLPQKSGVIIFVTGSPARGHVPGATAIGTAFGAIETLMENLAVELSPSGIRAVCLRTTANTDSRTIQESVDLIAERMGAPKENVRQMLASYNFLKTPGRVADTAHAVAFLASDEARLMTGTVMNSSAGAALD